MSYMYDDYHSFMEVHQYLHRLGGLGANLMLDIQMTLFLLLTVTIRLP